MARLEEYMFHREYHEKRSAVQNAALQIGYYIASSSPTNPRNRNIEFSAEVESQIQNSVDSLKSAINNCVWWAVSIDESVDEETVRRNCMEEAESYFQTATQGLSGYLNTVMGEKWSRS